IAVTAQVDVTRTKIVEEQVLPKGKGSEQMIRTEKSSEHLETESTQSGEPGPRSNQAADINRGDAGGNKLNTTESTSDFESEFGHRTTETLDPRGMTTGMAVSVNVPRGYVARLVSQSKARAGA